MITQEEVAELEKDYKRKLKPGTKKHVEKAMQDISGKYLDLVWYARSHPKDDTEYWDKTPNDIKNGAFKSQDKVRKLYPAEVKELDECETNWQHGFNSGMLACVRYLWSIEEVGKHLADESFPELYT